MNDLTAQHKTLNIRHAHNGEIYAAYLKHSNYVSPYACSLKENLEQKDPTQSDLSISRTNLRVNLPYPVMQPFHWEIQNDPCFELVREKTEYKRKLESYRRFYANDGKHPTWSSIKNDKKNLISLPHYVVDLAVNGDKNVYFDGKYDWFYTRGTLDIIDIQEHSFLISAQEDRIFSTNTENFSQQQLGLTFKPPIYNIRGYSIDDQPYVTLREKHCIKLAMLNFQNDRTLEISTQLLYDSNVKKVKIKNAPPFIDVLVFGKNRLITANVAYEVNIHDIETKKLSHQRKFQLETSNNGDLCQLESVSNCLLFMARDTLTLLDFRLSSLDKEKQAIFRSGYFQCDNLCTLCVSSLNNHYVYLASKHNVFKCDLREMKVVKKWAHLLDNSPIVIKAMLGNNNGEEYVFVASFAETICIHVSAACNHLPFKLDDITATYKRARMDYEFWLREDLEQRFQLATAGLVPHDFCIFTANSIGDVYKHAITNHPTANENAVESVKAFVDKLPNKPRQLHVTHIQDLSTLRNVLLEKRVDANDLAEYSNANPRMEKFLNPMKAFGKYDMAMIWQSGQGGPLEESRNEDDPNERIDTWLAQTAAEEFDPVEAEMEVS